MQHISCDGTRHARSAHLQIKLTHRIQPGTGLPGTVSEEETLVVEIKMVTGISVKPSMNSSSTRVSFSLTFRPPPPTNKPAEHTNTHFSRAHSERIANSFHSKFDALISVRMYITIYIYKRWSTLSKPHNARTANSFHSTFGV